jgi:cytidylate kinase
MRKTITIARQLGSGGSYIGQLIASRLGLRYIDREVLHRAAEEFGCDQQELEARAERVTSFWDRLWQGLALGTAAVPYVPPPLRPFSDKELFNKQAEILKAISQGEDCVIVGYGGAHVLPEHPGKVNIFCHAPMSFRIRRVMELYHAGTEEEARRMIQESDEMRKRYFMEMAGKDWACAENYHVSVDTSLLPLETTAELLLEFLRHKGIVPKPRGQKPFEP